MLIQMKTQIAGTRNGLRWPLAGATIDLPEGEANDLVREGLASVVDVPEKPKPEKRPAVKKPETR